MKITDSKVDELAHLARLTFSADSKSKIKSELEQILDFCEKLNKLDTDGVEPLVYMSDRVNHLRPDVVQSSLEKSEALKNAPSADSDFYKVPKVIKK